MSYSKETSNRFQEKGLALIDLEPLLQPLFADSQSFVSATWQHLSRYTFWGFVANGLVSVLGIFSALMVVHLFLYEYGFSKSLLFSSIIAALAASFLFFVGWPAWYFGRKKFMANVETLVTEKFGGSVDPSQAEYDAVKAVSWWFTPYKVFNLRTEAGAIRRVVVVLSPQKPKVLLAQVIS